MLMWRACWWLILLYTHGLTPIVFMLAWALLQVAGHALSAYFERAQLKLIPMWARCNWCSAENCSWYNEVPVSVMLHIRSHKHLCLLKARRFLCRRQACTCFTGRPMLACTCCCHRSSLDLPPSDGRGAQTYQSSIATILSGLLNIVVPAVRPSVDVLSLNSRTQHVGTGILRSLL
jgi:hypothetical protein